MRKHKLGNNVVDSCPLVVKLIFCVNFMVNLMVIFLFYCGQLMKVYVPVLHYVVCPTRFHHP